MLMKLMKHEFRATYRLFLPLFIGAFIFSFIVRMFVLIDPQHPALQVIMVLMIVLYALILVCVALSGLIIPAYRFYKNTFTDEGYLTNTLPVKASSLITSKLIVGFVMSILSYVVLALALGILVLDNNVITNFMRLVRSLFGGLGLMEYLSAYTSTIVLFIVAFLVQSVCSLLMIYVSFAIGSLANRRRVFISVAVYIGIYTFITTVIGMISAVMDKIEFTNYTSMQILNIVLAVTAIGSAVISVVFYIVTNLIMSKKLNLE